MAVSITHNLKRFAQLQLSLCRESEAVKELPAEMVDLFSGREEWEARERDCRGNLDFQHNSLFWSGRHQEPVINRWLIESAADASTSASPWPQGKKFAVCLTHDVDLVTYAAQKPRLRQGWELFCLLFGDTSRIITYAKSIAFLIGIKHLAGSWPRKGRPARLGGGLARDLLFL